jgi:glyoxylase-like metal-dependent hydrolase (beta-lactamase superfamily II)
MPTGTPYNSFVQPYAIRVDGFADSPTLKTVPLLHLLSHTHTDHIQGLSARSFGHPVYCSQDAKEMLLRHEVFAERQLREMDVRAETVRTFSHLKVKPRTLEDGTIFYNGARDLLVSVFV